MTYSVLQTSADDEDRGWWDGFATFDAAENFRARKALAHDGTDSFSVLDAEYRVVESADDFSESEDEEA